MEESQALFYKSSKSSQILALINRVGTNSDLALIGDADFLFFLSQSADLVKSIRNIAQRVVLTPNVREFERLYEFLF